ncbi:hypothetical protein [uncultured Brevundimonas sp.]|uniref:hypothetical protein n=1 Tax=uncultured Brevundimonas sp. TaxID=213418 RepID=UPI0030EF1960
MTDRTIRSLAYLHRSASTARLLNLHRVHAEYGDTDAWAEHPMFLASPLNRAMVIKHRLRRNELDVFAGRRHVATKLVIPINADDLSAGGSYVFVDQIDFDKVMLETFGMNSSHPDLETLRFMDQLPSLDPFLLREQLRRGGIEPAPCYFGISTADTERMADFVEQEIMPLVTLSLGSAGSSAGQAQVLTEKILSNAPGDRMEALREALRLPPEEYLEGVFCWKGFLYYKWVLTTLSDEIADVVEAIATIKPIGTAEPHIRDRLIRSREVLSDSIFRTCDDVALTIQVYDKAYASLMVEGGSTKFREFLIDSPSMFRRLGDQLGAIQHIISFWRFRFGRNQAPVEVGELLDIFMDFEAGLAVRGDVQPTYQLQA